MVPKQMRQLLRKHSSEDGEIEDYLQTGAFEKRSNEMRLFSLDGTAQQDIQNMIELSQSVNAEGEGDEAGISSEERVVAADHLSPVQNFAEGGNVALQSNQLLNLVQHMEEPLSKVRKPEILNQMRQKIIFSGVSGVSGEREDDEEDEEELGESQLSSPEMNCT